MSWHLFFFWFSMAVFGFEFIMISLICHSRASSMSAMLRHVSHWQLHLPDPSPFSILIRQPLCVCGLGDSTGAGRPILILMRILIAYHRASLLIREAICVLNENDSPPTSRQMAYGRFTFRQCDKWQPDRRRCSDIFNGIQYIEIVKWNKP